MNDGIPGIQAGAPRPQPVSDFLERTEGRGIDDRSVRFLYVSRNNQLKVSSNWFTHILRMPFRAQGLAALLASMHSQFGHSPEYSAEDALRNIGDLRRMFKEHYDTPVMEDGFEPDNDLQTQLWSQFQADQHNESLVRDSDLIARSSLLTRTDSIFENLSTTEQPLQDGNVSQPQLREPGQP